MRGWLYTKMVYLSPIWLVTGPRACGNYVDRTQLDHATQTSFEKYYVIVVDRVQFLFRPGLGRKDVRTELLYHSRKKNSLTDGHV